VEGDLEAEHFNGLQAGARVTGNISYRKLKLDCGATVDSKLERMGGELGVTEGAGAVEPKVLNSPRHPGQMRTDRV
jgi:cytoskeletal protein CcmA (bactofilin family)